jgi:ABC-2 type transport system permease protein
MFRQILTIIRRDLISTTRDAILLYITLIPIVLTLGLRFLLPSVGQASVQVVITEAGREPLEAAFAPYAEVEVVPGRAELDRRVLAYDDAVGVIPAAGGYTLVLEGNESHDARVLPAMVLNRLAGGSTYTVEQETAGDAPVPYKAWVAAFVALSITYMSSIIMGLHIIEDKESGMMQALGVTPLRQQTYIAARSVFVFLLAQAVVFGSLIALGVSSLPVLVIALTALAGSSGAVLMGFALGALSSNQLSGIANLKFGFLLVLVPAIVSLFISPTWQRALYWLPPYWTFAAFRAILVDSAGWSILTPLLLGNVLSAGLYLVGTFPMLRQRLNFAAA